MGLQFAYWAPNVSGGLVISNLPQKTGWSFEDNKRYAQIAEENGFDYVLLQTRFFASYGAEKQLEAAALASALAASTQKIKHYYSCAARSLASRCHSKNYFND